MCNGNNPILNVCVLTHWGRVTHICVGKLTIIGSDNGLSPERRQAIIWTNDGILLLGPLGTNFSEILIAIQTFSLKKIRLKMSSAKCCSFRLSLNVLKSAVCWRPSIVKLLGPQLCLTANKYFARKLKELIFVSTGHSGPCTSRHQYMGMVSENRRKWDNWHLGKNNSGKSGVTVDAYHKIGVPQMLNCRY